MRKLPIIVVKAGLILAGAGLALRYVAACDLPARQTQGPSSERTAQPPGDIDSLLAPIALYPDQLLAQMLLCAGDPASVRKLNDWLIANQTLKGSELQDAAVVAGFEPSFVALAVFPQIVATMAEKHEWTTLVGQAFAADRGAVFASIQKLRAQARDVGTLKSTTQQQVETRTTSAGQEVIVIEPTNPQVVYVPQYNPTVVYTHAPTTVVVQESSTDAVAAGLIGFTAGIAIGAAVNNSYYYGPYGWRGGGYMYNDAWDDWYDAREDAREDWMDHREDLAEERGDRARTQQEQRTERRQTQQGQRTERQQNRQENRPESGTQRASGANYESRGHSRGDGAAVAPRSGTGSDAFSGYSSGRSERAASARGSQSRSSSRSRSGGGRRR